MTWILLLIQLIPSIINAIVAFMDLIKKLKGAEKTQARQEFFSLGRKHVRKRRGIVGGYKLTHDEETAHQELAELYKKWAPRVG